MLLYLHIPFCDSKCHYCSFNSFTNKNSIKRDYVSALLQQFKAEKERFDLKDGSLESVFIGGGTPSTLELELFEEIFTTISPYLKKGAEITTEANPNSASKEWLLGMKNFGVNRISFGVQSFDAKKLSFLGRNHSPKQAIKALENAHTVGIKHLSCDIIYDTAMDTKELLEKDLKQAFSLPINHLSAYSLTIEEGTKFFSTPHARKENLNLIEFFINYVKNQGFKHYEISNFGTYESQHNLGYWQLKDYLGVGCGAVGFLKNSRYYPTSNLEEYIKNPLNIGVEKLSQEDLKLEKLFLGLRSKVGFHETLLDEYEQKKAQLLMQDKKLSYKNGYYFNNDFLLSDELALFIIE